MCRIALASATAQGQAAGTYDAAVTRPEHADKGTVDYFENHTHDYSPARLRHATAMITTRKSDDSSLVDVGCGTGNVLAVLAGSTGITDLWAMDVSASALAVAAERVKCRTVHASILDGGQVREHAGRYDFALAAALLHHLVGRTRRSSRRDAETGVRHALELLRPGGHLVVFEPVCTPKALMSGLFWLKRLTTTFTGRRIGVRGYWNNIGAPLVSFYGHDEVVRMVENTGLGEVVEVQSEDVGMGRLDRVLHRSNSTILVRRI